MSSTFKGIHFCAVLLILQVYFLSECVASTEKGHKREWFVSANQQVFGPSTGGGVVLQSSPNTGQRPVSAVKQDSPTDPLNSTSPKPDKNEVEGNGCCKVMDLVLVLDSSHSITPVGWAVVKKAVSDLVELLDISKDCIHVAILKYSTNVTSFYMFDSNPTKEKTLEQIKALSFDDQWSRLDTALIALNDYVLHVAPAAGTRPDVPKVVVVFTDGKLTGPREPDRTIDWLKLIAGPLDSLRLKSVVLFSVAVSKTPDYATLDLIAGDRARVFTSNNIVILSESLGRIAKELCPASSTTSPSSATPSASSSSSVDQQASSSPICTTTASTCVPKPTCSPSAKPPCVNLYLVQVCNTYVTTTPCQAPKTISPSIVKPASSSPAGSASQSVVPPPCPQPPIPGCIAPTATATVPPASQSPPLPNCIPQAGSTGSPPSNNPPSNNQPPFAGNPQMANNAPQQANNPQCLPFGCPTPPEKRCT